MTDKFSESTLAYALSDEVDPYCFYEKPNRHIIFCHSKHYLYRKKIIIYRVFFYPVS